MYNDSLSILRPSKKIASNIKPSSAIINLSLRFEGHNKDITESYYWFFNFPYYTGKGYNTIKLEDYHYFSESSQFGTGLRQGRGNSIRAFQENLNQLIQLIKVHLLPLLKEVKETDYYHSMMQTIIENDNNILEENKKDNPDKNKIEKFKNERNMVISNLKDKWVMEKDSGRLWQIQKSEAEGGLDYVRLPDLFFAINIEDPLCSNKTIEEQLNEIISKLDVTIGLKRVLNNFLYRFYAWLPSAIKEIEVTFGIKKATLRQFYSQIQMYIEFMKPLLFEIHRKSEGFDKKNFYHGFEMENYEFSGLLDFSYAFIRTLGIQGFARAGYGIKDVEFMPFGLYVEEPTISTKGYDSSYDFVKELGKEKISGFITGSEKNSKGETEYLFVQCNKEISAKEFKTKKAVKIPKQCIKNFPIIELEFSQKRRSEQMQTQQGPQMVPYMINLIEFHGYCWDLVEIASYREQMKAKMLDVLETFVSEISAVKEDLLKYLSDYDFETEKLDLKKIEKKDDKKNDKEKTSIKDSLLLSPIVGLWEAFRPLFPNINIFANKKEETTHGSPKDIENKIVENQLKALEDTWKIYTIYKKSHGFIQY